MQKKMYIFLKHKGWRPEDPMNKDDFKFLNSKQNQLISEIIPKMLNTGAEEVWELL